MQEGNEQKGFKHWVSLELAMMKAKNTKQKAADAERGNARGIDPGSLPTQAKDMSVPLLPSLPHSRAQKKLISFQFPSVSPPKKLGLVVPFSEPCGSCRSTGNMPMARQKAIDKQEQVDGGNGAAAGISYIRTSS
jgi:hypothetical protein